MSYDIVIKTKTGETLQFPTTHGLAGGTYAIGGTDKAWLNVTYNYTRFFTRVLGKNGIRSIYGLTPQESIPILDAAIAKLGNAKPNPDYWKPCAGNAKAALLDLKRLAELAILYFPKEELKWDGD